MPERTEPITLDCAHPADAREAADLRLARLRWHCRRGLLELDLVLARFVDGLSPDDPALADLERLLAHPDRELLQWLQGEDRPADEALAALIGRLQDLSL
ncbi:MAG: FAD assembly factor SdhE [Acidiferrobacteraceae bacterium]